MRAISAATKTRNAAHVFPTMATLCALGVVYGDIGTSPLYALREAAKAASGESMPTPEAVLGTVSLITWPNRTHARSSLQNIRLSSDVANPLSRSRN